MVIGGGIRRGEKRGVGVKVVWRVAVQEAPMKGVVGGEPYKRASEYRVSTGVCCANERCQTPRDLVRCSTRHALVALALTDVTCWDDINTDSWVGAMYMRPMIVGGNPPGLPVRVTVMVADGMRAESLEDIHMMGKVKGLGSRVVAISLVTRVGRVTV